MFMRFVTLVARFLFSASSGFSELSTCPGLPWGEPRISNNDAPCNGVQREAQEAGHPDGIVWYQRSAAEWPALLAKGQRLSAKGQELCSDEIISKSPKVQKCIPTKA
jgi:hypothetical protein